ncbi:MAG TPA: hypothetical protein VGU44_04725 [Gammaproteobacteria bacterium]|nr:hypothetical protein [Gammaproteobacteria bacterium]
MHYKTTYILPLFERQIYFQSPWHEDEEDAANRFFNIRNNQLNKHAQATPFFQANTDLYFSAKLNLKENASARGRAYILNSSGGLIAKFYDFVSERWRILYQGPWLLFVNQFSTTSESLYSFKFSKTDAEECFLTLTEAKLLAVNLRIQALMFKEPERLRADAHFIESQINTLKEGAKK